MLATFTWEVGGVLTDADAVRFSDPTGTYGMRRVTNGQVVIPNDTPWDHAGVGVYTYDFDDLLLVGAQKYQAWIEVEFEDNVYRYEREFLGEGAEAIERNLRFVLVEDGAMVLLDDVPRLSAPTGAYGAIRTDTKEVVANDGAPYSAIGTLYTATLNQTEEEVAAAPVYLYYVEVTHDGVTYHLPHTTARTDDAMLAVGRYSTSFDIEQLFGVDNVHSFLGVLALDSPVDYAIRAWEFIRDAEAYIDDRLRMNCLTIPFEEPIPPAITDIAAALAGVAMYEWRGTIDMNPDTGQPFHRYAKLKKDAEDALHNIKMGTLKLYDDTHQRHPEVIRNACTTRSACELDPFRIHDRPDCPC